MASSTPMGKAELSPRGNSGNPATSFKPSPATAQNVRAHKTASMEKIEGTQSESLVRPSNTGLASTNISGEVSGGNIYSQGSDAALTGAELDLYRYGKGNTPARIIDEGEKDAPATIRVSTVGDSPQDIVTGYSNFMLQAVSEGEQEKYQVVETFTAYYAFFYGKRPPVYSFSGILLNDQKHNWADTFKYMYANYFRGTKTAELGAQAYITYRNKVVSGFLIGLNMQEDAVNPNGVPFTFTLLVISEETTGFSSDFDKFVEGRQEIMAALKVKAEAEIKSLNKDANTKQMIFKNQVLNALVPPMFSGKSDEAKKTEIPSNQADSNSQRIQKDVKSATAVSVATGNDLAKQSIANGESGEN